MVIMIKKLGYIRGGDVTTKREFLMSKGVHKGDVVVEYPAKRKLSGDMEQDWPRLHFILSILRNSQILEVPAFEDLGRTPVEVLQVLMLIGETGGKLHIGESDEDYAIPTDVATRIRPVLAEMKSHFGNLRVAPARRKLKESGTSPGPKGYFEVMKKKKPDLYDKLVRIWGTECKEAAAISAIDDMIAQSGYKRRRVPGSPSAIRAEFGPKKAAERAAKGQG